MEPWAAFFDAHYVLTYAPLQPADRSRAEALAAARLAKLSRGARVLDVPCGYGRHAAPLAAAGYRVVGLDRSASQLGEARRRRDTAREPRLVRGDYREIPLADGSVYDGALTLQQAGWATPARMRGPARAARDPAGPAPGRAVWSSRRTAATGWRPEDPVGATWYPLGDERRAPGGEPGRPGRRHGRRPHVSPQRPGAYPQRRPASLHRHRAGPAAGRAGFGDIACYGSLRGPVGSDTRLILVAAASARSARGSPLGA